MADRWFRLPETGDGTVDDAFRPDFFGHNITDWSGNEAHPEGNPSWVVRVYGDETTLDALADEPRVTELSAVPIQALNNMFGLDRDASGHEIGFSVGPNRLSYRWR